MYVGGMAYNDALWFGSVSGAFTYTILSTIADSQDLEDLNKPKLTDAQWNDIQRIVEIACETFNIEIGDCEYEMQLDYDNRIQLNSIDLGYQLNDLGEHIMDRLTEVFGTVKEEE